MAFSTDITLSGSFVNLNSVSGLATNLNFIAKIMRKPLPLRGGG